MRQVGILLVQVLGHAERRARFMFKFRYFLLAALVVSLLVRDSLKLPGRDKVRAGALLRCSPVLQPPSRDQL